MATLNVLGYLGNEPGRMGCALHELRSALTAPPQAEGFGLAHFMDDRLLLNKRPSPVTQGIPLAELVGPVRTSTLLLSMHTASDGGPYKFRSWAFAMQGCDGREPLRAELVERLPDFLTRNISGDSVGEASFHRFLATLHSHNKVDDITVDGLLVAQSLRQTLDAVASRGEARASPMVLMATNGRVLVCAHQGSGVAYSLREGIMACQRCQTDRHTLDPFPVRESHRRFKGVVVAGGLSEVPDGFIPVPEAKTVLVTRRLDVNLV